MAYWFHRNPLKATAPVTFELRGAATNGQAQKICWFVFVCQSYATIYYIYASGRDTAAAYAITSGTDTAAAYTTTSGRDTAGVTPDGSTNAKHITNILFK